jgi:hypothetical protein
VKVPDREAAREIIWFTDGLLSRGGHALPIGLMAALREYKSALLAESANEPWAQPGYSTRYGILADLIEQELAMGKWEAGERIPSDDYFAEIYQVKRHTVARALHVLTVRGKLALEHHSYYVLPRDMMQD